MIEKQPPKFLLLGLPGTGKTTTFKACIDLLKQQQAITCNLISTDDLINNRMKNPNDNIILKFKQHHKMEISSTIFNANNPSVEFVKFYGEEPLWRDLEEQFSIDIIQSSNENDWFDFGAKALMRQNVVNVVTAKNIIRIFLYAEHETIIARLNKLDGWRERPSYANAALNAVKQGLNEQTGWQTLAQKHREERLEVYKNLADIIISVEKTDGESFQDVKSPEEIAQEIFESIKKLQLSNSTLKTPFSHAWEKVAKGRMREFEVAFFIE